MARYRESGSLACYRGVSDSHAVKKPATESLAVHLKAAAKCSASGRLPFLLICARRQVVSADFTALKLALFLRNLSSNVQ